MNRKKQKPPQARGRQAERLTNTRMICPPASVVKSEIPITDLPERILRLEELASFLLGEIIQLRGGGCYEN